MILVEHNIEGSRIKVSGHSSGDSRVCAAVGAALMTAHVAYKAPAPSPGAFSWFYKGADDHQIGALNFITDLCIILEDRYPEDIKFIEI